MKTLTKADREAIWERDKAKGDQFAKKLLSFCNTHFLILSALFVAFGLLGTMLFVIAFLAVFDGRLFWLIEYPDLLKIGIIGACIYSALVVLIAGLGRLIHMALLLRGVYRAVVAMAVVGVIAYGLLIFRNGDVGANSYTIHGHLILLSATALLGAAVMMLFVS
jgi:hypothetical protein